MTLEADDQRCLKKKCSKNMQQIYRRTPMPKCNMNKVACNFMEITLWGKKCSFFGKFGVLRFLETPNLRFALLAYYR